MDSKDSKILRLLQVNGKMSYADIGNEIDLSITAVKERIKRLQSNGVLKKNVFLLDPTSLGLDICAFVLVLMPVPSQEADFVKRIDQVDEIQECHCITGEYSYLLKVRARNTKELEQIIGKKIKTIKGVVKTNSIIALTSSKEITQFSV